MSAAPGKTAVFASFRRSPVIGVVRTHDTAAAGRIAREFLAAGLELVEITFTVPDAPRLVRELQAERGATTAGPWVGMGTVTTGERADEALSAGADFLVTPNVALAVAAKARAADRFLVLGALSPTEIVAAHEAGADVVKVFPLPPIGGPGYLSVVRGPLGDIPMLAAGGFGIDEIPAYRAAGAVGFGMGPPLVGADAGATHERVRRALAFARGEATA